MLIYYVPPEAERTLPIACAKILAMYTGVAQVYLKHGYHSSCIRPRSSLVPLCEGGTDRNDIALLLHGFRLGRTLR